MGLVKGERRWFPAEQTHPCRAEIFQDPGVVGDQAHETIFAMDSAGKTGQDFVVGVEGARPEYLFALEIVSPKGVGKYVLILYLQIQGLHFFG